MHAKNHVPLLVLNTPSLPLCAAYDWQEEAVLRLHTKAVTGIAVAPSGHVASASEDGSLIAFDAKDPHNTQVTVHTSKVRRVAAEKKLGEGSESGEFVGGGRLLLCVLLSRSLDPLLPSQHLDVLPRMVCRRR